jgi:uncharacterized protein
VEESRFSILVLGDVHGSYGGVRRIVRAIAERQPDLVALVGDLGCDLLWSTSEPSGKLARWRLSLDRLFEELEPLGVPVVFVPGNHDAQEVRPSFGALNLDGRLCELGGLHLAGVGGAGPAIFGLPYEWTDKEMETELERRRWAGERIDVLLCHAPPFGTALDRLQNGMPVGSRALSALAGTLRPALYLCGHIHEAVGHRMLGPTLAVNAGRLIFSRYGRFGRPVKGAATSYQFYRIELRGRRPQSLERVRISCRGPLRVLEHALWQAGDGFQQRIELTGAP